MATSIKEYRVKQYIRPNPPVYLTPGFEDWVEAIIYYKLVLEKNTTYGICYSIVYGNFYPDQAINGTFAEIKEYNSTEIETLLHMDIVIKRVMGNKVHTGKMIFQNNIEIEFLITEDELEKIHFNALLTDHQGFENISDYKGNFKREK